MVEYSKPWLSLPEQVARLAEHCLVIDDATRASAVLQAVGYYRLTGYLYPFRESEGHIDDVGRHRSGSSVGQP